MRFRWIGEREGGLCTASEGASQTTHLVLLRPIGKVKPRGSDSDPYGCTPKSSPAHTQNMALLIPLEDLQKDPQTQGTTLGVQGRVPEPCALEFAQPKFRV